MGACHRKLKIFAGNSNPQLAGEIAANLETELVKSEVGRFSDGEISVQIVQNFILGHTSFKETIGNSSMDTRWGCRLRVRPGLCIQSNHDRVSQAGVSSVPEHILVLQPSSFRQRRSAERNDPLAGQFWG